jgi:hypothetical protein
VGCSARNRSGFWWLPGTGGFGGTAAGGGWSRSRSCDIDQREPLVLPALPPEVLPVLDPVDPLVGPLDPAPVSVLGVEAVTEPAVEGIDVVVVVDVVSLVVDVVVGVVEVVVVVEPGVALEPVLL